MEGEAHVVKHIVLWRLKEEALGALKMENALAVKKRLEALNDIIPEINFLEVGINFNNSAAAYDVALYSEFKTMEDLAAYQEHPEHVKVAEFIQSVRDDRAVVDYKD